MRKGKLRSIISLFIVLVLMTCAMPLCAYSAESGDTIRVGACAEFGITKTGGNYSGFAYDYLTAMQTYTGHRYTYVEAQPEELLQMLSEGVIDIIPCVTQSEYDMWKDVYFSDREYNPELSSVSLMKKFTAVYVTADNNDISYFDTDAIKDATIGYLAENKLKYFSNDSFVRGEIDRANFVEYATEAQMKSDFYEGKIDAVVKDCFTPWENEVIVYQYATKDCYFLTSGKDVNITSSLDVAVNSLHMANSSFSTSLYEKYIEKYGSANFALSSAEKAYIEKNPLITVAYNNGFSSLENFNGSKIVGYTDTVLKRIADFSGLTIEVRSCDSLEECVQMLARGDVQVICGGVNSISVAPLGNYRVSMPYSTEQIVAAGKESVNLNGNLKIAIPHDCNDITQYASQMYKNATLLPYDDIGKCMQAVRNGDADIVCAGLYEIIFQISSNFEDIKVIDNSTSYHEECFAFNANNTELARIFGKAIASIRTGKHAASYSDAINAANSTPLLNLVPVQALYIGGCAVILILVGVLLYITIINHKNKRASNTDPITGGRNKKKYIEDTRKLLKKRSPEKLAVVLFDINKFKYVNDCLGYEEGDRMLARLHKTLADNLENDEVFARVSNDNFACTIRNAQDNEITMRINNIFAEFERRNNIFVKYPIIFSAGVCRLGQCLDGNGGIDMNAAIDRCTIAKKTLKGQHFSSIAFYDGKIREKALREKDYENAMPAALAAHEFECYLQPKYGLKSRRIEGAEALIRWNSKEFGFVFPSDFIPISEKNSFVVELDFFILEEVCKVMRRWLDEGKTPVIISVNQSRMHLNYDDYIWRLREIVDKYEIPYKYIELELTESVFAENAEKLLTIMQKLHDIGFKLSLDDFGSGYSSLNMLKDIPVDVVKIDREFFNGTVNSEKGRAVISTVVDLAASLNMEVISEGVETLEQVEFLSEINCDMVQGYYFAKPMTMSDFETLWNEELDSVSDNINEIADTVNE